MRNRTLQPKPQIDYRAYEVRASDDRDGFDGHAATFWAVDSYATAMKPGAFRKTLKERGDRIPLLWQHWPDTPIGKPTTLKEDKTGLAFSASVTTDTRAGAEAMALLRDDVPLGMSFGFQTLKDRSATEDDPLDLTQQSGLKPADVRVIEEVRLWELSLVTFPANDAATITAVRSELELDALSSLLADLRADRLDAEHIPLIEQFVAAWQARAGAEPPMTALTPTPDRTRRRDIEAQLALAKYRGLLREVAA